MTSNIGQLRLGTGEHVSNKIDMAEILNEYFPYVSTTEYTDGIVEDSPGPVNTVHLNHFEFTEETIIRILENINVNKTSGPDCIWNSLPAQVVNNNTIESFKTRLDKFLNPNINYFAPRYIFLCFFF